MDNDRLAHKPTLQDCRSWSGCCLPRGRSARRHVGAQSAWVATHQHVQSVGRGEYRGPASNGDLAHRVTPRTLRQNDIRRRRPRSAERHVWGADRAELHGGPPERSSAVAHRLMVLTAAAPIRATAGRNRESWPATMVALTGDPAGRQELPAASRLWRMSFICR
jgi:hypothetical protein